MAAFKTGFYRNLKKRYFALALTEQNKIEKFTNLPAASSHWPVTRSPSTAPRLVSDWMPLCLFAGSVIEMNSLFVAVPAVGPV